MRLLGRLLAVPRTCCMEEALFAHAADAHLGSQDRIFMKEGERTAFKELIDTCIGEHVDFLLFSGDLFDSNVPSMNVASFAAQELKRLREHDIPAYEIHGSHDNSPTHSSMIEVLENAGLLVNASRIVQSGDLITLEPIVDRTGVKIYGMPGLREGREKEFYEILDREKLESEQGRKVFMFHSAISELRTGRFAKMEAIPLSYLPHNFSYYAGGHVHARSINDLPGFGKLVYPGPLFAGWGIEDITDYSRNGGGFFLVHMSDDIKVDFVKEEPVKVVVIDKSADGLSSQEYVKELEPSEDYSGTMVVLKLHGKLKSGRVADISSEYLRAAYAKAGAKDVMVSRGELSGPEQKIVRVGTVSQLEETLMAENVKPPYKPELAKALLEVLSREKLEGETDSDYEERLGGEAERIIEDFLSEKKGKKK